jgi:CheY-specific phosphatase CheX
MSSTTLPEATADASVLADAVIHVVEQSFFAFAETCGAADVTARMPVDDRWLRSAVHFSGDARAGHVEIALPHSLARDLAAAFAGADPYELTEGMIVDATGELCNMICGLWLTRTCPHGHFALRPPVVSATETVDPTAEGLAFALINDVPAVFSRWETEAV